MSYKGTIDLTRSKAIEKLKFLVQEPHTYDSVILYIAFKEMPDVMDEITDNQIELLLERCDERDMFNYNIIEGD